jgi:hypothetical protein
MRKATTPIHPWDRYRVNPMTELTIQYLVKFDSTDDHWHVLRAGKPTGIFARDLHGAVELARHEASVDAKHSELEVTVWIEQAGRVKVVWRN